MLCLIFATASSVGAAATKPTLTMAGTQFCPAYPTNYEFSFDSDLNIAYDSALRANGDYGEYDPGWATSVKLSGGNKVVTIALKHNFRFSDGTPFNAKALKTWMTYSYAHDPRLGPVRSISTIGQWKVRVALRTPNPDAQYYLSNLSVAGKVISPKAVAVLTANPKSPIMSRGSYGLGPYVFDPKASSLGDHCTYVPNKYYPDKSIYKFGKIVTRHITDFNTGLAGVENGQINVFYPGDPSTISAAKKAHVQILTGHINSIFMDFFDHGGKINPALGDVRVRQALNYAIDRKAAMNALWPGTGTPTSNPMPYSNGDDPKYFNYYTYNPTKAKSLLSAAGYPNGFKLRMLAVQGGYGYKLDTQAQILCKYYEAINVKCDLQPVTPGDATAARGSGTYDGESIITGSVSVANWYRQSLAPPALQIPAAFYVDQHGWHDPTLDKMVLAAQRLNPTSPAGVAAWKAVSNREITQAYFVEIGSPGTVAFVTQNVGGVKLGAQLINSTDQYYPK
jgi:peptide/nickel transport system substrate-binding protein